MHLDSVKRPKACPQHIPAQPSVPCLILTQLESESSTSISPIAGVPTSGLHQASSSKSFQPSFSPIVKEVAPSHPSHHVIASGSDLEEVEVASMVSSQSSEPIVHASDDGLQNQNLSLRDFVGYMGKVWSNYKDWVLRAS